MADVYKSKKNAAVVKVSETAKFCILRARSRAGTRNQEKAVQGPGIRYGLKNFH